MSDSRFSSIQWDRPWLAPFCDMARLTEADESWRTAVDAITLQRRLVNHRGMPINFVDQAELPPGIAYESFISITGGVPTRNNLHDFFNALVWLTYPCAKAALNAVQAAEINRLSTQPISLSLPQGIASSMRGMLRDRATLFDENAAILVTSEAVVEVALRSHDWHQALIVRREAFGTCCEVRLFGHALIEKLVLPYKAISAHVWVLNVDQQFFDLQEGAKALHVDRLLSQAIDAGMLRTAPIALPVLGVPGWWHEQEIAFYDDKNVFRPSRSMRKQEAS